MAEEIKFTKYEERGACHIKESQRSVKKFNAEQQARFDLILAVALDVKNKRVVDVGCGDGALTAMFCRAGAEVIGIDPEELGLKYAQEYLEKKNLKARLILGSAYQIDVENNWADVVIVSDVIEHVREPEKLLAETKRILKTGGKIIITTPYRLSEKPFDKFHVKEYFPGEIKNKVEEYFKDVKVKETHRMFWHAIYAYEMPWKRARQILRYLINAWILLSKNNPFMIDNSKRSKWDIYTQILVTGIK